MIFQKLSNWLERVVGGLFIDVTNFSQCLRLCSYQSFCKKWPATGKLILPFPTSAFFIVKQLCTQNIWRTTWARIMISGIQFGYRVLMTWLTFHKILQIFDWIIPFFRLRHFPIKDLVKKIHVSGELLRLRSWYLVYALCLRPDFFICWLTGEPPLRF